MKKIYMYIIVCAMCMMNMQAQISAPTGVSASDITSSSAVISWESDGVYYDVRYKLLDKGGTTNPGISPL